MKKDQIDWDIRIRRLLLLGIIFGVLWVKEYLWTAFCVALVLYLGDVLIMPFISLALTMQQEESSPPPRSRKRRETMGPAPVSIGREGRGAGCGRRRFPGAGADHLADSPQAILIEIGSL